MGRKPGFDILAQSVDRLGVGWEARHRWVDLVERQHKRKHIYGRALVYIDHNKCTTQNSIKLWNTKISSHTDCTCTCGKIPQHISHHRALASNQLLVAKNNFTPITQELDLQGRCIWTRVCYAHYNIHDRWIALDTSSVTCQYTTKPGSTWHLDTNFAWCSLFRLNLKYNHY